MLDVRSADEPVSAEGGISKEKGSGKRNYYVSNKWSSWNRGDESKARRGKVYCDKWIHEGFCAFAHVGCKYLHVMPMDAATQVKLGLYHGLPRWYSIRTKDWRQAKKPANNGHDNMGATTNDSGNNCWPSSQPDNSWYDAQGFGSVQSFGPIAPPSKSSTKL
ncbi:hypothetical protein V496_08411 [Pseudogymnoascus sp. VKM F-4515 (FW-2607)]|nr:hypothetical protein V496_08411 [Pseudogymnoascus sp. VKM F-4515 (FW-2607)]